MDKNRISSSSKLQSASSSNMQKRLHNWTIPKVGISDVYSKSLFDFTRDSSIQIVEHTETLKGSQGTLHLLSNDPKIRQWRRDKYLHLGLVQVAVKPLHGLGIDAPFLLCLRDARFLNFQHSLLAVVESDLKNGPVYFNYYPNYPVSLSDPHLLKTLTLNVKTEDLFAENSRSVALSYRVCYKVMDIKNNPKARKLSPVGETQFYEADFQHPDAFVSKRISWDQVMSSSKWNLPPEETDQSKSSTNSRVLLIDGSSVLLRSSSTPLRRS